MISHTSKFLDMADSLPNGEEKIDVAIDVGLPDLAKEDAEMSAPAPEPSPTQTTPIAPAPQTGNEAQPQPTAAQKQEDEKKVYFKGRNPDLIDTLNKAQQKDVSVKTELEGAFNEVYKQVVGNHFTSIYNAVKRGDFEYDGNVPMSDLAIYCAYRNNQIVVTDENASYVKAALTSVATNGAVKDDYDGSLFMSLQKMTDDAKHKLKEGLTIYDNDAKEKDKSNAIRKWDETSTFKAYDNFFSAQEAGLVGMQIAANDELRRKVVGLKEGEDFFELPHERQMEIVNNVVPLYGDLTRFKAGVDGFMQQMSRKYVDCNTTNAGTYILEKIFKYGKVDGLFNQEEQIKQFLESGRPRTEEELAEWLGTGASQSTARLTSQSLTQINNPLQTLDRDDLVGVKGEDGKWHLQYRLGGHTDREFFVKDKVISDLIDTDGRYTAMNIVSTLNAHPIAWSFFKRWVSKMDANQYDTSKFLTSNLESNWLINNKGVSLNQEFTGDTYGTFDMMMDYLMKGNPSEEERNSRWADITAAMQAFSMVDRRRGMYTDNTDLDYRIHAGMFNTLHSGLYGTLSSAGKSFMKLFGDKYQDYAANYASKTTSEDKAKVELIANNLMSSLVLLEKPQQYSDNTFVGGVAELGTTLTAYSAIAKLSGLSAGALLGSVGAGVAVSSKIPAITKLPKLATALGKSGGYLKAVGKWVAIEEGKLSPAQRQIHNSTMELTKFLANVNPKAAGAKNLITYANAVKKSNTILANMFKDPRIGLSFSEHLAKFFAKLPTFAFFYDEAKGESVGSYVINSPDLSDEALNDIAKYGEIKGVISGLMMAGCVEWAKGYKILSANPIKRILPFAESLDKELEGIINGAIVTGGRDATKTLARRAILINALLKSQQAFAHNAKFMFTLEEANMIADNFKYIADERRKNPDYQPTVYDYIGRGQDEALAETAKMASTMAITTLGRGAITGVMQGGISKGAKEAIANTRGYALSTRLDKEGYDGRQVITDFVLKYVDAKPKERKQMRDEIRKNYSEDIARLFDQLAFEIERPRSEMNRTIRSNVRKMRSQEITVDGIRASLAQIGQDVRTDAMPDGSVMITIPKGTKIGGIELDRECKFVTKAVDDLNTLHIKKDAKGKVSYDVNWCNEVITNALVGNGYVEFTKALNEFLGRQMNETQRMKKLARLRAGENIEHLLDIASKESKGNGIFIPKSDTRFGKYMQGEDANLVDGLILLANANTMARTPAAGTKGLVDAANVKGISVETFLHEYFHAITSALPITAEQRAVLQETFGTTVDENGNKITQNWQEGFVDAFLRAHFDSDAMTRSIAFMELNKGGMLGWIQNAARELAGAFGIKTSRFIEESEVDARLKKDKIEPETLDEFIGDVLGITNEIAEAQKKAEKVNEEIASTREEICGGQFSVAGKSDTKNILETFRRNVYGSGGFGKNPKHSKWVKNIARSWTNGSADLSRYPDWAFGGFTEGDEMLAQSLCVASLNSVNDSQTPTGYTSLTSLRNRSGISIKEQSAYIIANAKNIKGLKGFDPATCISYGGGAGYLKINPKLMETFRYSARQEQEKNMTTWAKENDCYFNNIDSFAKDLGLKLEPLGSGAESTAFVDKREGKVYKHMTATAENTAGDLSTLLDRIVLFNNLFPEANIKVIGWGREKHPENFYDPNSKQIEKFGVFVEQPYLVGAQDVTEAEVDALMKDKGFRPVYDIDRGVNMFVSEDGNIVVRDINGGGVVRYPDGKIGVIDAICSLNTKQNVRDDVVPSADMVQGKFKEGTWNAVWDVKAADESYSILGRIEEERRKIGATAEPETGKPYIAIGYHGTTKGGFEVFNPKKSDDGLSIFMAESKEVANTYAYPLDYDGTPSPLPKYRRRDGIYNLAMRFDNPLVIDADGKYWNKALYLGKKKDAVSKLQYDVFANTRQVARMAFDEGYDGVIIENVVDYGDNPKDYFGKDYIIKPSTIYIHSNPNMIKVIDEHTYDRHGNIIPVNERLNWKRNNASWNVVGIHALNDILGSEDASELAKGMREEFKKAYDALNSDESRDARRKIKNDEINAWLAKRQKEDRNEFTIDFDGTPVLFRFYKGGADDNVRIEYAGESATVPRTFKKKLDEEVVAGKIYNGLRVGDFYMKDVVLNSAPNNSKIKSEILSRHVFVKGTPAYESYKEMRTKGEELRLKQQQKDARLSNKMYRRRSVDPIFIDGVGVNEFGDVVLESLGDNRITKRRMNQALVKLMQAYEGWETPITASREYYAEVAYKRDNLEGNLNFVMGDQKLRNIVDEVFREYISNTVIKGRALKGLDTDVDAYIERVNDALCAVINDSAKYYNAEIEARILGERFGKSLDSLPEYSDVQKEVIDGLIKPYNRNGLKAQESSKNVIKFYRDVALRMIYKYLNFNSHKDSNMTDEVHKMLSNEFMARVKNYIRDTIKEYVKDMGAIEKAEIGREDVYRSKEYIKETSNNILAVKDTTTEQVGKRLDKASTYEDAAMKLATDFIRKYGVDKLKSDNPEKTELFKKMRNAVIESIGEGAKYYAEAEIASIYKSAMIKALSNEIGSALFKVSGKKHDLDILSGFEAAALKQDRRRAKAQNSILRAHIRGMKATKMKATRIRNATGMSMAEVSKYFGRDTISDLKDVGTDPNAPILNAKKFADDMTTNFATAYYTHENFVNSLGAKDPNAKELSIAEFFKSPIAAAEYTATVAEWMSQAARELSFGQTRTAIERDVARLRWLVRPSFETTRDVLESGVKRMVAQRMAVQTKDIIAKIKKVIDSSALAKRQIVQNKEIYKRDVDPLVQSYWKEVKDCMDMTQERVDKELEALQQKWRFGENEWEQISGVGSEGIKELTADQIRDKRKALVRATALTRYGALKYKSLGELGDKINEIAEDIVTHRERFTQRFAERVEQDKKDVNNLVSELTEARGRTTGSSDLNISKSRAYWRSALYYNTPDLFLRLKMYFKKGSPAYELCEDFRRNMSLAHIQQEQMISEMNEEFIAKVQEIYGKSFDKVIDELLTPNIEYAKYSRSTWGAPIGGHRVVAGGDPNATRSANGLSIAQLMYIYAACNQKDMESNNMQYGRDARYFKEIANIIGKEGIALIRWMQKQLEAQRTAMSPISEAITGMPVVKPTMNYFPLKFEQKKNDPMDKSTRFSPKMFPSFLTLRVNHNSARLEERVDIFNVFHERMNNCAHYVSFMPIIDKVKTTFSDPNVQTAFSKTIGHEAYTEMYTQLATALNGGRSDSIHWLRDLRNFAAASTLFYNIPSAMKQIEGVGGWSAEMGVLHWFKNLLAFNLGSKVARDQAASVDDVLLTRQREGYSDVALALKESINAIESGRGTLHKIYNKYKKHGLQLTELVDRIAARSMAGAYFNQQVSYYRHRGDSMEVARQKAIADVDYCIQTTQQSSRPEFQISAQRGDSRFGEFGKVAAQFAGPAYVRLGMELEALHRYIMTRGDGTASKAEIKEARKQFINKVVALHVICPTILTALELLGSAITHNEDDYNFLAESMEAYARNVLTGPFAGAFVVGALVEDAAGVLMGQRKTAKRLNLPMLSRMESVFYKTRNIYNDLKDACMGDLNTDSLLRYTLDWIEALTPAIRHGENAIRNVRDMIK